MSKSQKEYPNRGPIEYTSAPGSSARFSPPIPWIHVVSAGSGGMVVEAENGTSRTYAGLQTGDVLHGPFNEITSMTVTKIRVGDGRPPSSTAPSNTNLNGASVADLSAMTVGQVLRATSTTALGAGAVNLALSAAVTGLLPLANQADMAIAGNGATGSATLAIDQTYVYNATGGLTLTFPAISSANDGRILEMVEIGGSGSTAVLTPGAAGDAIGNSAASGATVGLAGIGIFRRYRAMNTSYGGAKRWLQV